MFAFLRSTYDLLLTVLEGIFLWIIRPRVIVIIILTIVIAVVTYILYQHPVFGIAARNFVQRTLPELLEQAVKILQKFWPVVLRYLPGAFFKKWIKPVLFFLLIPLLSRYSRKQLQSLQQRLIDGFKHNVRRPRDWWKSLSKPKQYLYSATLLAIALSVPGLHYLGYLFFPFVLVGEILLFGSRWIVGILGAKALVAVLHARIMWLLAKFFLPEDLQDRKWKYLRRMVVWRRELKTRYQAVKDHAGNLFQRKKNCKECKDDSSSRVTDES